MNNKDNSAGIAGLTFAFSGRLDTSSLAVWRSREQLEGYLQHYGARISKSVTANVDYVVLLDGVHTAAAERAKELGIQVLNENEFDCLVGRRFADEEHVSVPSWMDHIPADAFRGTSILDTPMIILENTTIKTVSLPDTITRIDHGAFFQCENLVEINIPESVDSIGSFAFCGCRSLKRVTLPKGLTILGDYAFDGCTELEEINVPDCAVIGARAFKGCKLLQNQTGLVIINGVLVDALSCPDDQVIIPDGVRHIGESAFEVDYYSRKSFNHLTAVHFPSGLISIGKNAFAKCRLLTTITLPEGLENIGPSAFSSCSALKRAWIPNSVTIIGTDALPKTKLRIFAQSGSYAEQYAKENRIRFTPCEREDFIERYEHSFLRTDQE